MATALVIVVSLVAIAAATPAQSAQRGIASVYNQHSQATASGRRGAMTAAHKSLPFGSRVRVTNRRTGRSVVVTIVDRGPFVRGRVIDLNRPAGRAMGLGYSVAPVTIEVVR